MLQFIEFKSFIFLNQNINLVLLVVMFIVALSYLGVSLLIALPIFFSKKYETVYEESIKVDKAKKNKLKLGIAEKVTDADIKKWTSKSILLLFSFFGVLLYMVSYVNVLRDQNQGIFFGLLMLMFSLASVGIISPKDVCEKNKFRRSYIVGFIVSSISLGVGLGSLIVILFVKQPTIDEVKSIKQCKSTNISKCINN